MPGRAPPRRDSFCASAIHARPSDLPFGDIATIAALPIARPASDGKARLQAEMQDGSTRTLLASADEAMLIALGERLRDFLARPVTSRTAADPARA